MKKKMVVGLGSGLVVGSAMADTAADITAMQTAATSAIDLAAAAVSAIVIAGLVITISLWAYGKMKQAIKRN